MVNNHHYVHTKVFSRVSYALIWRILSQSSQILVLVLSRFYTKGLNQALAMIHAVEMANRSPMLSSLNITLGYRIYDICSDVTTALWAVQDLTRPLSDCDSPTNSSQPVQPITALIGTTSSEISIAIARELNLMLIPQVTSCKFSTQSSKLGWGNILLSVYLFCRLVTDLQLRF